jgi:hypothetical protein
MRHRVLLVVTALVAVPAVACQSRTAPREVQAEYVELIASLDQDVPGESLLRLKDFAKRYESYDIASRALHDAAAWRNMLQPRYLEARDLVRDGQFDQAERALKDLALVPDEPAGKQSSEFLAFEFHRMKASRLLVTGDTTGADAAARALIGSQPGDQQMAAAQQLLDAVATARLGARMTMTTALQSSARALQVFLHSHYADMGQYPARLTLDDPALADLRDSGALDAISSLDDYQATQDTFSVIVTGADGRRRIRITNRGLEEVPALANP